MTPSVTTGLGDPATREAWWVLLEPWLAARPRAVARLACGTGSLKAPAAGLGHAVVGGLTSRTTWWSGPGPRPWSSLSASPSRRATSGLRRSATTLTSPRWWRQPSRPRPAQIRRLRRHRPQAQERARTAVRAVVRSKTRVARGLRCCLRVVPCSPSPGLSLCIIPLDRKVWGSRVLTWWSTFSSCFAGAWGR
jgi:hypothetical protein